MYKDFISNNNSQYEHNNLIGILNANTCNFSFNYFQVYKLYDTK